MSHALRCIVYVSTATMSMAPDALEELLVDARDHNLVTGVTGVLLLCEGTFMQCIEGTGPGFDETWDRIRGSRRHRDVTVMVNHFIRARSFGDWQMGFFGPTSSTLLAESTVRWKLDLLMDHACHTDGRELVEQFWRHAR